jgi:hypothetical protein
MNCEDLTTPGLRVKSVGELSLDASRLIEKRQRAEVGFEVIWEVLCVFRRLMLNSCEGTSLLFCLKRSNCVAIDEEQIISLKSALQREFPYGNTYPGVEVNFGSILNDPTSSS